MNRISRLSLSVLVWGSLWAFPQASEAVSSKRDCSVLLQAWNAATQFLFPERVEFDRSLYFVHLADYRRARPAFQELDSPEKLFAYRDSLASETSSDTYLALLSEIEYKGGRVYFQKFRIPVEVHWKPWRLQWNWSTRAPIAKFHGGIQTLWWIPYWSSYQSATLFVPGRAPRSETELTQFLFQYSLSLTGFRVGRLAAYAAFQDSNYSAQVLQDLEEAESHLYSTLAALEAIHGKADHILPKRDGVWRWPNVQLLAEGLPRLLFPFYNPIKKYEPCLENRAAYIDNALTNLLRKKFQNRLRFKWFADRYRSLLMASIVSGLSYGAYDLTKTLLSGEFQTRWQNIQTQVKSLRDRFSQPRLNSALEEYQNNLEGEPTVTEYYELQIRELEEKIKAQGDADGALNQEIQDLIERRDLLKN
jgi:hypothetical protein